MQQYIYGPIEAFTEVRLLELAPGDHNEPLEGEIISQLLNRAKPFCAISYAWGSDEKDFQLDTPDGYVPLTKSLQQALLAIRDPQHRILIWADAICIDQDDLSEKGGQISIMRDIYAKSSETIVYLGDSSPVIDLALDAIQLLCDRHAPETPQKQSTINRKRIFPSAATSEDLLWTISSEAQVLRLDLESGIRALCTKEWFSRRWVVQEVVVAQEETPVYVHCGRQCIEWFTLVSGLAVIITDFEPHSVREIRDKYDEVAPDIRSKKMDFLLCYRVINSITRLQMKYRNGILPTLCDLIKRLDKTDCKRKHDLVLSLIGISSIRDSFNLNWEKVYSQDVDLLCLSAALAIVEREGLQEVLSMTRYLPAQSSRPSWIPHVDHTFVPTAVFFDRHTNDIYRNVNPIKAPRSSQNDDDDNGQGETDPHVLSLGVYVIDAVELTLHYSFNSADTFSNFSQVSSFIAQSFALFETAFDVSPTSEISAETAHRLCALVLLAGWCWSNTSQPSAEEVENEIWHGFLNLSQLCLSLYLGETEGRSSADYFSELMSENSARLQLALEYFSNLNRVENMGLGMISVTRRRFTCNLPNTTSEGDLLAVIPGVGVPVVLQESESMPGTYRYLGPAYVLGLMHGEALSLEGIQERWIKLR